MKKVLALVVGTLALASVAGLAQAETRFAVQDVNANDKMVVTDQGKVGIGITIPLTAVHIKSADTTVVDMGSAQLINQYAGKTTNAGGGGFIVLHNNQSVPVTNPNGLPIQGDRLGYFLFGSVDGTTQRLGAGLTSRAEGAWSSTSTPAALLFETSPPNAVGTAGARPERMRITGTGNVGIGTGAPTAKLEVKDGGVRINIANGTAQPPCTSSIRGTLWITQNATLVADTVAVCLKDATDAYVWKTITLAP